MRLECQSPRESSGSWHIGECRKRLNGQRTEAAVPGWTRAVRITAAGVELDGDLAMPEHVSGLVLFAHGSGSSRHSPRNRAVAEALNQRGLATLLVDLLTGDEDRVDARTRELRFDIGMLADRLIGIVDWLRGYPDAASL